MTRFNDLHAQNDVAVVGLGSMGGGLALLIAQHGARVACFDIIREHTNKVLQRALNDEDIDESLLYGYDDLKKLSLSFTRNKPRVIVFSLPHGSRTDQVLSELEQHLVQGDIILDCANEHWDETERRQGRLLSRGVRLLGCGISGGYQAARHGPSMSPGGDRAAYDIVRPLFEKWAAKTVTGDPCVRYIGTGGSGHYVKMIHNGIEQGFLSAIAEAYGLLRYTLNLSNLEISNIFETWNSAGELKGNYLVGIGAEILRFTKGDGLEAKEGIVDGIEDRVVQDADDFEGTGTWTVKEFSERHVAGPTIAAAHFLRVISAEKAQRLALCSNLRLPSPSTADIKTPDEKKTWVEKIRIATYGAILASYIQGCNIIAKQSKLRGWGVSLADCIHVWRAGCIIESEYICDLLQPHYARDPSINALLYTPVSSELAKTYVSLKDVVRLALDTDAVVPTLSATLEYMKSVGGRCLPNNFQEAELDFFGHHNYDLKRERRNNSKPANGSHHTEWKPASS